MEVKGNLIALLQYGDRPNVIIMPVRVENRVDPQSAGSDGLGDLRGTASRIDYDRVPGLSGHHVAVLAPLSIHNGDYLKAQRKPPQRMPPARRRLRFGLKRLEPAQSPFPRTGEVFQSFGKGPP